jgi:hypothetical protein
MPSVRKEDGIGQKYQYLSGGATSTTVMSGATPLTRLLAVRRINRHFALHSSDDTSAPVATFTYMRCALLVTTNIK